MSRGNLINIYRNFISFRCVCFFKDIDRTPDSTTVTGITHHVSGFLVSYKSALYISHVVFFNSHSLFSNCYVVVNGYDYALFAGLLELLPFFWASRFSCQSRNSSTSCLLHIFRCSFVTLCCTVQLVSLLILTIQSFVVSFILILYHMFRECQGVFLFFLLLFGWLCPLCPIRSDKVRQGQSPACSCGSLRAGDIRGLLLSPVLLYHYTIFIVKIKGVSIVFFESF